MKDILNKNKDMRAFTNKDLPLIFLFWLKIFFGIVGGITYYFIHRIMFHIGSFNVHYILRGLFINSIIFAYFSFIQFLIIFILLFLKKKIQKLVPNNENVWRFSLRFSFMFIVVFLISAIITFYIGF